MLILTVFSSSFSLAIQNADATTDSGDDRDEIGPMVRISKIVTIAGSASSVTLNLEGTAFDTESGIDKVDAKVNYAATLQLLSDYEPATATGPEGESDYSTWAKQLTFDQEGTYRLCVRATDKAGNQNWFSVTITVDFDAEADEIKPAVSITSPENNFTTVTGPASGVTLNLEGTAFDAGRGVATVELKINDPATFQLLSGYTPATATGPEGEDDYSTWAKQLTFDQEGTYRVTARATDKAGNQDWWHVSINVEFDDEADDDDSKIAFASFRDGNGNSQIYVMNADGTNQTNLSNNIFSDVRPSWSPDGTKIVFASQRDGNSNIYVMNADGTGQTRLTNSTSFETMPDWSPDGTKIAFAIQRAGAEEVRDSEIYVMNADGTNPINLSNNPSNANTDPDWAPNGTKIAFTTEETEIGEPEEVYVMNADGTGQTNLSNNPEADDSNPSWSPDGSKIAFESDRDGNLDIHVMDADGTSQNRLTDNEPPAEADLTPTWSPDGTKLTFARFVVNNVIDDVKFGHYDIFVINADGTQLTNLTNGTASNINPSWSPGGM